MPTTLCVTILLPKKDMWQFLFNAYFRFGFLLQTNKQISVSHYRFRKKINCNERTLAETEMNLSKALMKGLFSPRMGTSTNTRIWQGDNKNSFRSHIFITQVEHCYNGGLSLRSPSYLLTSVILAPNVLP